MIFAWSSLVQSDSSSFFYKSWKWRPFHVQTIPRLHSTAPNGAYYQWHPASYSLSTSLAPKFHTGEKSKFCTLVKIFHFAYVHRVNPTPTRLSFGLKWKGNWLLLLVYEVRSWKMAIAFLPNFAFSRSQKGNNLWGILKDVKRYLDLKNRSSNVVSERKAIWDLHFYCSIVFEVMPCKG